MSEEDNYSILKWKDNSNSLLPTLNNRELTEMTARGGFPSWEEEGIPKNGKAWELGGENWEKWTHNKNIRNLGNKSFP